MSKFAPGIPDSAFFRDDVPMTKQEVRAVSLSKLQVLPGHRCLDIGSGTGSMTVEMALLSGGGDVIAVDSNPFALKATSINAERFGVSKSVRLVEGDAPQAFEGLGTFDRIFVGGSGEHLLGILSKLASHCSPNGAVVVANAICVETLSEMITFAKNASLQDFEVVEMHLARGVPAGAKTRFVPHSPVWVVSFSLGGRP